MPDAYLLQNDWILRLNVAFFVEEPENGADKGEARKVEVDVFEFALY